MKNAGRLLSCVLLIDHAQSARAQIFEVAESSITNQQKTMTEGRVKSKLWFKPISTASRHSTIAGPD